MNGYYSLWNRTRNNLFKNTTRMTYGFNLYLFFYDKHYTLCILSDSRVLTLEYLYD